VNRDFKRQSDLPKIKSNIRKSNDQQGRSSFHFPLTNQDLNSSNSSLKASRRKLKVKKAAISSTSQPFYEPGLSKDYQRTATMSSSRELASRKRRHKPTQQGPAIWLLAMVRLLIFGVGIAAIGGTALSIVVPQGYRFSKSQATNLQSSTNTALQASTNTAPSTPTTVQSTEVAGLKLTQEMTALKPQITSLLAQNPELNLGLFLADLDTGAYLDIKGATPISTASMIKVPILVAFFQDVDAGKIRLNEQLTMRKDLITSESGTMQYQPPGTKFTALETAQQMIVISDNTATNMLIDRLGGIIALNQRFRSWGLTQTFLKNRLPDLGGTNVSTPRDLSNLLITISQGQLISLKSRDRMLAIMRETMTDTLLPQGLQKGATISHKTGDIGSAVGDVGLIDMPNGKRYVATAIVKRPYNDPHAQELIRQISKVTYQYLNKPPAKAKITNTET
jgi:beta-lactamase class A